MDLYKYETHLHTSEASACATASGAEMADAHKAAGYIGIIVTDHFFNGNTAIPRDLPWQEKVSLFYKGYENAKIRGDEIGLQVFLGWEFACDTSEFLTYGLDKNWLLIHPEIMEISIYEYADLVHQSGGFLVQAHPFRQRNYIKNLTLFPDITDAVEAFNAGNEENLFNERAAWYADSFNFPVTSGSDAHHTSHMRNSGITVAEKFNSIFDYINAVKYRNVNMIIC